MCGQRKFDGIFQEFSVETLNKGVSDLNRCKIKVDNRGEVGLQDPSVMDENASVEVVFRNLRDRLVSLLQEEMVVVGCVAWLTDGALLDALASVRGSSIVVQKEDFLRPDIDVDDRKTWATWLRRKYEILDCPFYRYSFEGTLRNLNVCSDPMMDAVRCVGNLNTTKQVAFPRMHNKFLVFCLAPSDPQDPDMVNINPQFVWTGSFNFTKNAGYSFENAVILRSKRLAAAYFLEFQQIYALSEPLDWFQSWCAPEFRIGT